MNINKTSNNSLVIGRQHAAKAAVLISALLLSACESGSSSGQFETVRKSGERQTGNSSNTLLINQPALAWSQCEFDDLLECSTLLVPIDYGNLEGPAIEIALARAPARGTQNIRTVLTNPGGPGGSGLVFLSNFNRGKHLPDALRDRTQFVSFDPRGIQRSSAIVCDRKELEGLDNYTMNATEIQHNINLRSNFAAECSTKVGDYLKLLGSNNVVRDMDEIRKALGQPQIDFLGFSYGTRIGGLYLQKYPQNSGRFVLDGAMSPSNRYGLLIQGGLRQANSNLVKLVNTCPAVFDNCSPEKVYDLLLTRLAQTGAGTVGSSLAGYLGIATKNPGSEEIFIGGLVNYLISENEQDLVTAYRQFGNERSFSAANYEQYGVVEDNKFTTNNAVMCADHQYRPTTESLTEALAVFNSDSNVFAEQYIGALGLCAGWPAAIDPIPTIATNQAPPALVIGGPTDAQTPLIFAQQMADAIGGQFLHSVHDGHTISFRGANRCTDSAVTNYLLNGNLPTFSKCDADDSAVIIADAWSPVLPMGAAPF